MSILQLLALATFAASHPPTTDPPPSEPSVELNAALLDIGALGCVSCHAATEAVERHVQPRSAPRLDHAGARLTRSYLEEWLSPSGTKPGRRMPHLLESVPANDRARARSDLVQFLADQGSSEEGKARWLDESAIDQGRQLYRSRGCIVCHGYGNETVEGQPLLPAQYDLSWIARKTHLAELKAFLLDPTSVWHESGMPNLNLPPDEAEAIAVYLLRDQAKGPDRFDGIFYEYYEDPPEGNAPDWDSATPVRTGHADRIQLFDHREDHFGFRFLGQIDLPASGEWTFFTNSDDGSRLWIDGELVVDNSGTHGMREMQGTRTLDAGPHSIVVSMFERGGGEGLKVSWQGPGVDKSDIPSERISHVGRWLEPSDKQQHPRDGEAIGRGRQHFLDLGCNTCHQLIEDANAKPQRAAPALADLRADEARGCLASGDARERGVPKYDFAPQQRENILTALQRRSKWSSAPTPAEELNAAITAFNCTGCHQRDGAGGPTDLTRPFFHMNVEADIGDEGRLPPTLTGIGAKLKGEWLEQVVLNGSEARPYMATQMPAFSGPRAERLVELLAMVDRAGVSAEANQDPIFAEPMVNAGRQLLGTEGFGCINCHSIAGHASLGMPGPDLAKVYGRIERSWFDRFLRDPAGYREGTRMPSYFLEGRSDFEVLDGDVGQQIDALWTYLSLGGSAPLPKGLKVDEGEYDVNVLDRPRMVGVFMRDVSPKTLCVGLPERLHYAFDSESLRVAKVWRGAFFDAHGTWHGRAGQLENPPSDDGITLPKGPTFATGPERAADMFDWPEADGRPDGWKKLGYRVDNEGVPTFRYQLSGEATGGVAIEVHETPHARLQPGGAILVRSFTLKASSKPTRPLYFRAAIGSIRQRGVEQTYVIDGALRVTRRGAGESGAILDDGLRWRIDFEQTDDGWIASFEQELRW